MKKLDIARRLARQTGVSPAEAADRLDGVVHGILSQLKKRGEAELPGLGKLRLGREGKFNFQRTEGRDEK
jgi:nucleoid DNA-binding protein